MNDRPVLVNCKKCGKKYPSNEFVLDPVYRLMVCRNCNRDRIAKDTPEAKKKVEEVKKQPAGWDHDDEVAAKRFAQKQSSSVNAGLQRIDADRVKLSCPHCKYRFVFNTEKRYPLNCPQCGGRAVK